MYGDGSEIVLLLGSVAVVLKLKGVEQQLRDLLPSQRRQLPLLHLQTQRQVFIFLVIYCSCKCGIFILCFRYEFILVCFVKTSWVVTYSWDLYGGSQAAADEDDDDDDDVDLFGEETEEEKKAAEERAATIKASSKKKECKFLCLRRKICFGVFFQ